MEDATDMSTPVTRGELRAELATFRQEFKQELKLEFRRDLEIWGGALIARMDTQQQQLQARMDTQLQQLQARMDAQEQRLHAELARHTRAILEAMQTQITVVDEKYGDLPGRVSRLESEVFQPEPRPVGQAPRRPIRRRG